MLNDTTIRHLNTPWQEDPVQEGRLLEAAPMFDWAFALQRVRVPN